MSKDNFSNQPFQELTDCLCKFIQIQKTMLKSIKVEGIIYWKMLLRIIISSMDKTSTTKRWGNYEEASVKLINTQLTKLKSTAKNKTETALKITKKNLQDG